MISVEAFETICRSLPYRHKGMFYSEVYLFLQRCAAHGVDLVIESGVKNGMSTLLLASAWPGEVISIDKDSASLSVIEGVHFIHGDSRQEIPRLLRWRRGRRAGVLIDGPKGEAAKALMRSVWDLPQVKLVAIHDELSFPDKGRHSHEEHYRQTIGRRLDALLARHPYARKYPDGPGLAIWEKPL